MAIGSLASPGVRWASAELVAIAAEQRRALEHRDLAPWEAPSTIAGMIADDYVLTPSVVDAVWRLTNHSGTLTGEWYESTLSQLPTAEHYVELLGIVAIMSAMDRMAAALGLDFIPLPEPGPGEPSEAVVPEATVSTHWVPTVPGNGSAAFDSLTAIRDGDKIRLLLSNAQYMKVEQVLGDFDFARGSLVRSQIEFVAARTARGNECFYCATGHAMLLGLSGGLGTGDAIDPSMFVTGAGVPHGGLIARFVEAAHTHGDDLPAARYQLANTLGPEALIEVAAVMGAVHMTNRLTNGTGTPLEAHYIDASAALRSDLRLDELATMRLGRPTP